MADDITSMSANDNTEYMSTNDDIITRLWQYTPEAPNDPNETRLLLNAAADEIEQLRHRVDRLNAALDDIGHLTNDRQVHHRIKEARRG